MGTGPGSDPRATGDTTWSELASEFDDAPATEEFREELQAVMVAQLVRRVRHHAGLTQAELAARIGTDQANVSRLERGGIVPTLGTLEKVAQAVGGRLEVAIVPANGRVRADASRAERTHGDDAATRFVDHLGDAVEASGARPTPQRAAGGG